VCFHFLFFHVFKIKTKTTNYLNFVM